MKNGAVNIDTLNFFSLCVFLYIVYVTVFGIFPRISSFSITITYISINDQVFRSSFSWAQNYNILYLKYFYLQKLHTITLTMMSCSIKITKKISTQYKSKLQEAQMEKVHSTGLEVKLASISYQQLMLTN